jgi:nitrate reductase assembly molybdenum cofactor insertion protein NarJ
MKNIVKDCFEIIADLFAYPNEELRRVAKNLNDYLKKNYSSAANEYEPFYQFTQKIELIKWEEIYTRTFEVQAITTLDIGYVLFGDDYKRGEMLVNLNNEHVKYENDCNSELPDHLPNVLRLLNKMTDIELRDDIIVFALLPALKKIIGEFRSEIIEKKNKVYKKHHTTIINNDKDSWLIYESLLKTLLIIVELDTPNYKHTAIQIEGTIISKINNELEISN